MSKKFVFNQEVTNAIIGANINNGNITFSTDGKHQIIGSDSQQLLEDLVDKAHLFSERNSSQVKLEDLHNDDFAHWLRDKGYYVTDQTRSGRSAIAVGEVDIMVRKENGTPLSIIEAFRLQSCTENNTVIDSHLNKLFNNYDTGGLKQNYILIYAESKNFGELWRAYMGYITLINSKKNFITAHKLTNLNDVSSNYPNATDIRVARADHSREGIEIAVYHIFINMYR